MSTSSVPVSATVEQVLQDTNTTEYTLYNAGSNTVYVSDNQATAVTGLPITPGGSVVWNANSALFAACAADQTSTLTLLTNNGAITNPGAIASQILAQGLASQIATAVAGSALAANTATQVAGSALAANTATQVAAQTLTSQIFAAVIPFSPSQYFITTKPSQTLVTLDVTRCASLNLYVSNADTTANNNLVVTLYWETTNGYVVGSDTFELLSSAAIANNAVNVNVECRGIKCAITVSGSTNASIVVEGSTRPFHGIRFDTALSFEGYYNDGLLANVGGLAVPASGGSALTYMPLFQGEAYVNAVMAAGTGTYRWAIQFGNLAAGGYVIDYPFGLSPNNILIKVPFSARQAAIYVESNGTAGTAYLRVLKANNAFI